MIDLADIPSPFYRVSLKAVVLNDQQKILVVQTDDGYWEIPGGGWEYGESLEQCMAREIMEEVGVRVRNILKIHALPYIAKGRTGLMRLKLAMPVTVEDGPFTCGEGIQAAKYITQSEFEALDMIATEVGIKQYTLQIWQ